MNPTTSRVTNTLICGFEIGNRICIAPPHGDNRHMMGKKEFVPEDWEPEIQPDDDSLLPHILATLFILALVGLCFSLTMGAWHLAVTP